jgi:hypothetical protein
MAAQFHKVHFRQISLGMPHVRQVLFTLLIAICKNACNALFMPAPALSSHSAAACVHSARSNGFALRAAATLDPDASEPVRTIQLVRLLPGKHLLYCSAQFLFCFVLYAMRC